MSLQILFRHMDATDALRERVEKRVTKFRKIVTYPMEVHVLLSVEKAFQTAEITCHAEHKDLVAVAKSKDMYEAIDLVVHKIETQLRRERDRKKKGHTSAKVVARKVAKLAADVAADIPHRSKKAR